MAEHGSDIAAVIAEPVLCNSGVIEAAPGFLELLRQTTTDRGTLLIFDEVITCFRIALDGATERFGVEPDLGASWRFGVPTCWTGTVMDSTNSFARLPRTSVSADATQVIKELILSGRLQPGAKLPSERELGETLGISRPTMRESIRSLVAMNILVTEHGRGTYVASLDTEDLLQPLQFVLALASEALRELFEARLLLEPAIAALAAERASDEEIEELRRCAAEAHDHSTTDEHFLQLDIRLHRLIVDACHNKLLLGLMTSLSALGVESRAMTVQLPGLPQKTAADHAEIVVIAARDPEAARQAMATHIRHVAGAAASAAVAVGAPGKSVRARRTSAKRQPMVK
jgi:GntR family transcriptional repressor for pyruvate dehydrogenase complex